MWFGISRTASTFYGHLIGSIACHEINRNGSGRTVVKSRKQDKMDGRGHSHFDSMRREAEAIEIHPISLDSKGWSTSIWGYAWSSKATLFFIFYFARYPQSMDPIQSRPLPPKGNDTSPMRLGRGDYSLIALERYQRSMGCDQIDDSEFR